MRRRTLAYLTAAVALWLFLSMLPGCGTLIRSAERSDTKDNRFLALRIDLNLLYMYWSPSSDGSWNFVGKMWPLTPITLVDLPIAVVIDTLSLPVDWYQYAKGNNDVAFWKEVLPGNSTPSVQECMGHLSPRAAQYVNGTLYKGTVSGSALDILAHVCCLQPSGPFSYNMPDGVAAHKNLSPETWVFIYNYAASKTGYCRFSWNALLCNPSMPPKYFTLLAADDSPRYWMGLATNPSAPPDTLRLLAQRACRRVEDPSDKTYEARVGREYAARVLAAIARQPATPPDVLERLGSRVQHLLDDYPQRIHQADSLLPLLQETLVAIAGNPSTPSTAVHALLQTAGRWAELAKEKEYKSRCLAECGKMVQRAVYGNPNYRQGVPSRKE